jgi:hypothetical protein
MTSQSNKHDVLTNKLQSIPEMGLIRVTVRHSYKEPEHGSTQLDEQ